MLSNEFLLAVALVLPIVLAFWSQKRDKLAHLRGPESPSLLLGIEHLWCHQKEVGDLERKWFNEYGSVVKTATFFNQDQLFIADPKACQYILQTSQYNFLKTGEVLARFRASFGGMGMVSSTGEVHQRQRRVILPAFATTQLRTFLDVFRHAGESLLQHWQDIISPEGTVINIAPWLSRATLDVIGKSAFGYDFNALDSHAEQGELSVALKNLFVESSLHPRKTALLYQGIIRYTPNILTPLVDALPNRQNDRFRQFFRVSVDVVQRLVNERRKDIDFSNTEDKDVLSVLLRANQAEDSKKRLSDEELIAQLMAMVLAGHDTTASTISWLLYELSRNPKDQERLRDEIHERKKGLDAGEELKASDYEAMPVLNAVLKEALRLHPIGHSMARYAKYDDVLPLSEPLATAKGPITELPISKGQVVNISVWGYNRLKSVWGEDADQWNIDRWFRHGHEALKQTGVGMVSNILTFSGGLQGCIGWRFAMMEAQAITAHLVGNFEFSPDPNAKNDIAHIPTGRTSAPMVRGDIESGLQVPLLVKAVSSSR